MKRKLEKCKIVPRIKRSLKMKSRNMKFFFKKIKK